ncbi:hypothetical protein GOBAR_AA37221 [Gossypium barbadense]|uniref:Uncharacterized protein n=1 Tax=Gossypium barbadense TaxID=3634 RepID=A0A2P5VXG2_GOSBA|nr:hypothetical protein GOBAR_AA37221 [Gossypium barbadense]
MSHSLQGSRDNRISWSRTLYSFRNSPPVLRPTHLGASLELMPPSPIFLCRYSTTAIVPLPETWCWIPDHDPYFSMLLRSLMVKELDSPRKGKKNVKELEYGY